ncbi:MAG: carboxypeptidase-like regulatory domain-containing protein, partial [Saprospiraceae bacterium]|nr:carboxypeptidase-like regulatory domain-containing protein [Saprospiraceae bacterium]
MKKTLQLFALLLLPGSLTFAQGTLKGVIKDTRGEFISYATVVITGTNVYAMADSIGQFSLKATQNPPFSIRINSVGYLPQEVQISGLSPAPVDIILLADDNLMEVVVTSRRRTETA